MGRKSVLVQRLVLMEEANAAAAAPRDSVTVMVEPHNEEELETTPLVSPAAQSPASGLPAPWSPTLAKQPAQQQQQQQQDFVFSPPAPPSLASPKRALFGGESNAEADARRQSCLSTPGSASKKPRVSFGSVELRKYRVSHGGSLSTPSQGAYPIGLSWEVKEETKLPLSEFEKGKSPHAPTNASPRRLDERQRKLLLEKVDRRSLFEKQASWETEREELAQLRRSRQMVGCNCTGKNQCGTSKCLCFKFKLACNDDSCGCTCETCLNPQRYNFDPEKVSMYRQAKMQEGPYTENDENGEVEPMILL